MAAECSKLQICCDVFCFSAQYTDVATLAVLARYTAGECYYYPSFVAHRDGVCFQRDLEHNLTRATAFEAVMRYVIFLFQSDLLLSCTYLLQGACNSRFATY